MPSRLTPFPTTPLLTRTKRHDVTEHKTPLLVLVMFLAISLGGAAARGISYGGGRLSAALLLFAGLWASGRLHRAFTKSSNITRLLEAVALVLALSLMGSITSTVLAAGSGALIDQTLSHADRMLFPLFDWQALVRGIARYALAFNGLSYVYVSLNWQPLLFIIWAARHETGHLSRFVAVWSIGLALCILPLPWLAAVGPYPFYGIGADDVPGNLVALAFDTPHILQGLRSGELRTIGEATITGLVTFPSFHACAAVILGWAFSHWRRMRWPMITLNVGMFLAAVPVGGHYFVDIVAGGAVAALAIALTRSSRSDAAVSNR